MQRLKEEKKSKTKNIEDFITFVEKSAQNLKDNFGYARDEVEKAAVAKATDNGKQEISDSQQKAIEEGINRVYGKKPNWFQRQLNEIKRIFQGQNPFGSE